MITAQLPISEGVIDLSKPATCYVYRAYDALANLLYVGMADDVHRRLLQHRSSSKWFARAATVEWEEYADRATAAHVEAELIQSLRPLHNTRLKRESHAERTRRLRVAGSDFSPMDDRAKA